jgi:DNA-binding LacI/PurR family transcriptional regulator
MASMKDVARLANVSVSTVSRVISGTIPVDDSTRSRVEEAIVKVNYRPNLLAQGLRSKRGMLIGFLVPMITHPAFAMMIEAIEESTAKRELGMVLCNTHNDPEKEAASIDSMLRRNIDGIIFSRVSDRSRVLNIIVNSRTPAVVIDRSLDHEAIPSVLVDNYFAGVLAARHLLDVGCRKLVCVTGALNITLSRERLNGFTDTLKEAGVHLTQERVFEGSFRYECGKRAVDYFAAKELDYDGIWVQSDIAAYGVLAELQRRGIRVPDDVALMGMDNIDFSSMSYPSITTISQPYDLMCEKAIEMVEMMNGGTVLKEQHILLQPGLVLRESTGR